VRSTRTPEYELHADAAKAVHYGLNDVADRIFQVLKAGVWRHFVTPTRRVVEHETFASYITTKQPDGLGTDVDTVRRVCRDMTYALDAVDKALQREGGRPRGETVHIVNGSERPWGNGTTTALRRLRKDRPDLHTLVLEEQLSAHAAMVQAGFRPRTATIRLDNIESIARTLRRNLTNTELNELRKALVGVSA